MLALTVFLVCPDLPWVALAHLFYVNLIFSIIQNVAVTRRASPKRNYVKTHILMELGPGSMSIHMRFNIISLRACPAGNSNVLNSGKY